MSKANASSESEQTNAHDPFRVYPDGLVAELEQWQALNWTLEDRDKIPKQPAKPTATVNAKSNDASTWGDFETALTNAVESESLGFGFPCAQPGHELMFIDVDVPGEWVPDLDLLGPCVTERSPSGNWRIILRDCDIPEWWTNQSDPGKGTREVKIFNDSGYITLTGDTLDGYGPPLEATSDVTLEKWLKEAWRAFNPDASASEYPWVDAGSKDSSSSNQDEWLTDDLVAEALGEIRPDVSHGEWIKLAYAVHDYDDTNSGKRLFEQWSKHGSKYDDSAERQIEALWSTANDGDGQGRVSVATLVEKAKENGWEPSSPKDSTSETSDSDFLSAFDVRNGGYAEYHPPRDGEGDGYYQRITNFQIETLSRLTHTNGTREYQLCIHPADGESYEVTCEPVVFNDLRKFRREVLDGWTATFDGSQDHLNRLKEFVGRQDAKNRTGTKLLGLHGDEWVTPDGSLTVDGWSDDPETVFTDVQTPLATAFNLKPSDGAQYDRETVKEILRLLPQTRNTERFLPVLGWFYAAPFRPFIQQWQGEFNLLNILGDTGAGKTATLQTLWQLFGVDEELPEAKATPFSIMRMIASSNAIPVILDEYKPAEIRDYKISELHSNLRESTRGGVVTKGRADMGVDKYRLKAPVCISGEQPIQGPAEERRTILTVFKRNVTVGETPQQQAFAQLVGGEANGEWYDGHDLSDHTKAYYQWVLGQDETEIHDVWEQSRAHVMDRLEGMDISQLDDLVIQGLQTIKFGCTLYRAFASEMGLETDENPVTSEAIDKGIEYVATSGTGADHTSHLDRLLGLLTRAANAGYVQEGEHFKVVRKGKSNAELRVHLPTAFDQVRRYARDHDVRGDDLLSSAQDYKARIKDAADNPESYVTTASQYTPDLNQCVGLHIADATALVDGFEPEAFGAGESDQQTSDRLNPVSIHDVATDQTGYPTVEGEIKTLDFPEGEDSPAMKATLVDGNSAIDVISWDNRDTVEHGEKVIIENADTSRFDGDIQLVIKSGVTEVHEAPEDGQRQLDGDNNE